MLFDCFDLVIFIVLAGLLDLLRDLLFIDPTDFRSPLFFMNFDVVSLLYFLSFLDLLILGLPRVLLLNTVIFYDY